MKEYYSKRCKVFMAIESGYYVRGKFKELQIFRQHKVVLNEENGFKWNAMSNSEKHLFFRVLANKSRLKSIIIKSLEFGNNGCLFLSAFLKGSLRLHPEDELLYYRLSKLLSSLHDDYIWNYVDDNDKLSALIDTSSVSEASIEKLNGSLEKMLRHFQQITDWKAIKNGRAVDSALFMRHQKTLYCLHRLDLSKCNIGDEGVKLIAAALAENDSLKELMLNDNVIGDDGAKAIGKMMGRNVTLKEIDLSNNQIDKVGFIAIVCGWQLNKKYSTLKDMDLSHNKTKLNALIKDKSVSVDVAVSVQELKESVKVASF